MGGNLVPLRENVPAVSPEGSCDRRLVSPEAPFIADTNRIHEDVHRLCGDEKGGWRFTVEMSRDTGIILIRLRGDFVDVRGNEDLRRGLFEALGAIDCPQVIVDGGQVGRSVHDGIGPLFKLWREVRGRKGFLCFSEVPPDLKETLQRLFPHQLSIFNSPEEAYGAILAAQRRKAEQPESR
jgi:anti-anti-sigma regulatory factor